MPPPSSDYAFASDVMSRFRPLQSLMPSTCPEEVLLRQEAGPVADVGRASLSDHWYAMCHLASEGWSLLPEGAPRDKKKEAASTEPAAPGQIHCGIDNLGYMAIVKYAFVRGRKGGLPFLLFAARRHRQWRMGTLGFSVRLHLWFARSGKITNRVRRGEHGREADGPWKDLGLRFIARNRRRGKIGKAGGSVLQGYRERKSELFPFFAHQDDAAGARIGGGLARGPAAR